MMKNDEGNAESRLKCGAWLQHENVQSCDEVQSDVIDQSMMGQISMKFQGSKTIGQQSLNLETMRIE
jgi:hypothetical protein